MLTPRVLHNWGLVHSNAFKSPEQFHVFIVYYLLVRVVNYIYLIGHFKLNNRWQSNFRHDNPILGVYSIRICLCLMCVNCVHHIKGNDINIGFSKKTNKQTSHLISHFRTDKLDMTLKLEYFMWINQIKDKAIID